MLYVENKFLRLETMLNQNTQMGRLLVGAFTEIERTNIILIIVAASLFLALELIAAALGIPQPVNQLFNNRWFYYAVMGTGVVHFFRSYNQSERTTLFFFGVVFVFAGWGFASCFPSRLSIVSCALALASVCTYLSLLARKKRTAADIVRAAAPAWLVVVATCASGMFIWLTPSFTPITYDTYLFLFEQQLGLRVASLVNALLANGPHGTETLLFHVYHLIPLMVALHYGLYQDSKMPLLLVISGALGAILYALYPAVGPELTISGYYDSIFPTSAFKLLDHPAEMLAAPRNAMPSLHATWAYFFLWNSSPNRRLVRLLFFTFALLTIVSTFNIGHHWFIDLIVALPFAAAVHGICAYHLHWRDPKRIAIVACGALLTAGWLILLRADWFVNDVPTTLAWAMIVSTVMASVYLVRQLTDSNVDEAHQPVAAKAVTYLAR